MRRIAIVSSTFAMLALAACTGPQLYGTGQAWQRQQCDRLPDAQDRARCLERASVPQDVYQRDREAAQRGASTASPPR